MYIYFWLAPANDFRWASGEKVPGLGNSEIMYEWMMNAECGHLDVMCGEYDGGPQSSKGRQQLPDWHPIKCLKVHNNNKKNLDADFRFLSKLYFPMDKWM